MRERRVGPVLTGGVTARAVAGAIVATNPDARVDDRGAYLRVSAKAPCQVDLETIREHLGCRFELPADLERIMSSYRGRLVLGARLVRWE